MAGRGRTTFKKRQKEQVRLERREQKAARKIVRKATKEDEPELEVLDGPPTEGDLADGDSPELEPDSTEGALPPVPPSALGDIEPKPDKV